MHFAPFVLQLVFQCFIRSNSFQFVLSPLGKEHARQQVTYNVALSQT
jgi:hypothetical protein